jgi:redox-sensitive bicupin YhaK (pirin superfamily)
MTVGDGIHYSEGNASPTDWARVFQIWLYPSESALQPGHEQKRFSVAQRRGTLCIVASPDARNGSLLVHQDALLYSSILERGQHLIHPIASGRGVWLHVVYGALTVGGTPLSTGDGVGVSDERAVSLTATAETEILLLDLGPFAGIVMPRDDAP